MVFVLDSESKKMWDDYNTLKTELETFNPGILKRPRIILFNKCDIRMEEADARWKKEGCPIVNTSSFSGVGLKSFVHEVSKLVDKHRIRKPTAW